VVNDLTGNSITATVAPDAANPDDPVHVLYRPSGGDYASAGSVSGSSGGSVQITGLANNTWYAVTAQAFAAADSNVRSLPAQEVWAMCHDGTNLLASAHEAVVAALRASANLRAYAADGNWVKADSRGHVLNRILDGWVGGRSPGRAPYIEVDIGEAAVPRRPRGHRGAWATGAIRIRVTARERDAIHDLVRDVVLCLQSDTNRCLGDGAHVVDFEPSIGAVAYAHPVHQCEITLRVRMLVEQGTVV
jgi:hypothetical protein